MNEGTIKKVVNAMEMNKQTSKAVVDEVVFDERANQQGAVVNAVEMNGKLARRWLMNEHTSKTVVNAVEMNDKLARWWLMK